MSCEFRLCAACRMAAFEEQLGAALARFVPSCGQDIPATTRAPSIGVPSTNHNAAAASHAAEPVQQQLRELQARVKSLADQVRREHDDLVESHSDKEQAYKLIVHRLGDLEAKWEEQQVETDLELQQVSHRTCCWNTNLYGCTQGIALITHLACPAMDCLHLGTPTYDVLQ